MEQNTNNINYYIELLLRRKWLLIIPTLVCSVIAVIVALTLPAHYMSSTLILIEGQQIPEAYVKTTDSKPLANRLNTLSQQIMSRTRLEKIAEDFNLISEIEETAPSNGPIDRVKSILGVSEKTVSKESVINSIRNNIDVRIISGGLVQKGSNRGVDAFTISYTSMDPYVARDITRTLASLFIDENLKLREEFVEGASEFLSSELDKAKDDLKTQELALRKFKETHMGSLPEQLEANLRTLDRLQLELISVTESIKNISDKKSIVEKQLGIHSTESSYPALDMENELRRLRAELDHLLAVYKEDYPDVIITRNKIKEVETRLENFLSSDKANKDQENKTTVASLDRYSELAGYSTKLSNLAEREKDIRKQISMYERRVEETPENEQRLFDIKRDYDISFENYQSLLEKKLNARLAENLEKRQKGERFRVLDPANLPEHPYKPDRPRVVMIGSGVGILIGLGLIMIFEFLNPTFRKPDDFFKVLDIPVLISIPDFDAEHAATANKGKFKLIKGKKSATG